MATLLSEIDDAAHARVNAPLKRERDAAAGLLLPPALLVFASLAFVAVCHLADTHNVDVAAGIHAALAREAAAARLYPDLDGDVLLGGTRYMPLAFVLHAGIARWTGEFLLSGKLLALTLAMLLGIQVFSAVRRAGCTVTIAFALAAAVLVSGPAVFAATTMRGDLLAVVLQLAALAIAFAPGPQPCPSARWRVAAAALLCTLAILAKLTAVWAAFAIVMHLLRTERERGWSFLAMTAAMLGVAFMGLNIASEGRMFANLRALSAAGVGGIGAMAEAPFRLLRFISQGSSGLTLLLPLALFGLWSAVPGGQAARASIRGLTPRSSPMQAALWTPYHTALVACVAVLLVVFADRGTVSNHLLDLIALCAIVCGAFLARCRDGAARTLGAALIAWCLVAGWTQTLALETRTLAMLYWHGMPDGRFPVKPLAAEVADTESLLTDSPWLAVARGRRPVVLDAYALARLVEADPRVAAGLVDCIRRQEFAKVVLADISAPGEDAAHYSLGVPVVEAINANYRLEGVSSGLRVLVPRSE